MNHKKEAYLAIDRSCAFSGSQMISCLDTRRKVQLMTMPQSPPFPGGSRGRVNRAGDAIRKGRAELDDYQVIEQWREAHRPVLNTFQAILRNRTRRTQIVVAQRHKRRHTIFNKLHRYPRMELSRMDDVAGCRLIFPTIDDLYKFRTSLHGARFWHRLKNSEDKYDYIKHPKDTGYRGVHDVYVYNANSIHGRAYKGLLIELQYRTFVQHAWATAVEVIGFITESQPKFERGDRRYQEAMSLASEIIARAFEGTKSCHPEMYDEEVVDRFLAADQELGLMRMLGGLNSADSDINENKNVILIFNEDGSLTTKSFRDATDALRELFQLEEANPDRDIVLVRADTTQDVREAFRNYFSDAREFIRLVAEGCQKLGKAKVLSPPRTANDLMIGQFVAQTIDRT